MSIRRVAIGIQARSTSSRFPRKVFEMIGGMSMLARVISAADRSSYYLNLKGHQNDVEVSYYVLCPKGDEIAETFQSRVRIIEGSEEDVLSRYHAMAEASKADYIVRLTSDCPLIPPRVITSHIKSALHNRYDYISNVNEETRTAIDGYDVEVMSKRAVQWLHENAQTADDREHVTKLLRSGEAPENFRFGTFIDELDLANRKLSVDTIEDLERVRAEVEAKEIKRRRAIAAFGKEHVHLS